MVKEKSKNGLFALFASLPFLAIILLGVIFYEPIVDQILLYNYTPPNNIVQFTKDTAMTKKATNIFYVSRPVIQDKPEFRISCMDNIEKSIVLGCYKSDSNKIYLLQVSDKRLDGVEQVTAAHEMLHAAYSRLKNSERLQIDAQLNNFLKTIKDPYIINTIDEYRKHGADNLPNELHSIFGTEVANLPSELEVYYQKYFTDRQEVVKLSNNYRKTFKDLEDKIANYDKELSRLKASIEENQQKLSQLGEELSIRRAQLNREVGNISLYNAGVPGYNQTVAHYNQIVDQVKNDVGKYNKIVNKRNSSAVVINELGNELNANANTEKIKPEN